MLMAEALFDPYYSNGISGSIVFSQTFKDAVRVDINLSGVPKGIHGIHVHQKPINFNLDEDFCSQAMGHFNGYLQLWSKKFPGGTPHGSLFYNTDRHIGDLCNNIISTGKKNPVFFTYYDKLISLIPDHPNCIVGRSIVIHDNEDDQGFCFSSDNKSLIESKISGNSGKRIACANIIRS